MTELAESIPVVCDYYKWRLFFRGEALVTPLYDPLVGSNV